MLIEFNNRCKKIGLDKGVYYMDNYFTFYRRPWFHEMNFSRREVVSICRIRSRTSLKQSLYRSNMVDSPNCDWCSTPESINHVFWQCPRYEVSRVYMVKEVSQIIGCLPFPIESLLSIMNKNIYHSLGKYISEIDLRI